MFVRPDALQYKKSKAPDHWSVHIHYCAMKLFFNQDFVDPKYETRHRNISTQIFFRKKIFQPKFFFGIFFSDPNLFSERKILTQICFSNNKNSKKNWEFGIWDLGLRIWDLGPKLLLTNWPFLPISSLRFLF